MEVGKTWLRKPDEAFWQPEDDDNNPLRDILIFVVGLAVLIWLFN